LKIEEKMIVGFKKNQSVRTDIMKASGQVGLNKPYRAAVYQSYQECIKGLYR